MLYGGPVSSVEDIDRLRILGFDFGEVIISSWTSRRVLWESGVKNHFTDGFFLVAHSPLEDPCDDVRSLWDHYFPRLKATIDAAGRMDISLLTIHLSVNKLVSYRLLVEKQKALKELVDYGCRSNVLICLENVTETADDLETMLDAVPGLGITLDVGHAQLVGPSTPVEIIRCVRRSLRHVHLHDNRGGKSLDDDLHLPIGEGIIDFIGILRELIHSGYDGTLTLELPFEGQILSKTRLQSFLKEATR